MNNFVLYFAFFTLFIIPPVWASLDTLALDMKGVKSLVGVWKPTKPENAPVLVWFHGGMTSGNCAKGLVAGDDLSKLYPKAIVVSASSCRENHWATSTMISIVDYALDSLAVIRNKPIEKVSLVGVSDGAIGVFSYSLNGMRQVENRLLISSNGNIMGMPQKFAALKKFKEGRWRFLQGGMDRLYSSNVTLPWIETFCKSLNSDCEVNYDPAGEHDWAYWRNKRLEWIRSALSLKNKPKPLTK